MDTATHTKTVADVRKVLNSFGADFSMKAQSTGLMGRAEVEQAVEDLIAFADAGYLDSIILSLRNTAGKEIRGGRYAVSHSAIGWKRIFSRRCRSSARNSLPLSPER